VKEKYFWYEAQQKEFVKLKHYLFSTSILTLPNLQQPFEIETDGSDYLISEIPTSKGIWWLIMVRHSLILSGNTQPTIKIYTPWFKLVGSGNITFWGKRRSSTRINDLFRLYIHKGCCKTIII